MGRVEHWLDLPILAQPDDSTCGPTCLQAVYAYYGLGLDLERVIREVPTLEEGGTLAVLMGQDALRRGFDATLLTFNLMVFDPSWFESPDVDLRERLLAQREVKDDPKLRLAIDAYVRFIDLGGRFRFEDLTTAVLRRYLKRRIPILTGCSATWLYGTRRERVVDDKLVYDDVLGVPQGHFIVLCGYDPESQEALVADPLRPNPFGADAVYAVEMPRLLCAILLGIVTYDANLLIIRPKRVPGRQVHANPDRRRHD